ncbi:MAG: glycosyltransferase [bacterium]
MNPAVHTALASPALTIALPVHDEIATLAEVVTRALAVLARLAPGARGEVLIVDDGSRDGSGALADRLAHGDPSVRVIHHPENRGYAEVQRACFANARGEWIFLMPADGQVDPACLDALLAAARAPGEAEVGLVVGVPAAGSPARASSTAYHLAVAALFGRRSWWRLGPCLLVRREIVRRLSLRSRTPVLMTELAVSVERDGARVCGVPIDVRARAFGTSARATLYARVPRILVELVKLRFPSR